MQEKEILCNVAHHSKRGCYGYGTTTLLEVIPFDMCKECKAYVGNKEIAND